MSACVCVGERAQKGRGLSRHRHWTCALAATSTELLLLRQCACAAAVILQQDCLVWPPPKGTCFPPCTVLPHTHALAYTDTHTHTQGDMHLSTQTHTLYAGWSITVSCCCCWYRSLHGGLLKAIVVVAVTVVVAVAADDDAHMHRLTASQKSALLLYVSHAIGVLFLIRTLSPHPTPAHLSCTYRFYMWNKCLNILKLLILNDVCILLYTHLREFLFYLGLFINGQSFRKFI